MCRPTPTSPPGRAPARSPPLPADPGSPAGVVRAIVGATARSGFTHAGNIAYLSLLALFPAAILLVGLAASFGRTDAGEAAIASLLESLPPAAAAALAPAIAEALAARAPGLVPLSALLGLWTLSSLIETLRGIIRTAHGLERVRPILVLRLVSGLLALLLLPLALLALAATLAARLAAAPLARLAPALPDLPLLLTLAIPFAGLFAGLWLLFAVLHPWRVRPRIAWPGALLVSVAWTGAARLTDPILSWIGTFDRTYGALTGIMVALLFFWILGLALVAGAETNAALSRRRCGALGNPFMDPRGQE